MKFPLFPCLGYVSENIWLDRDLRPGQKQDFITIEYNGMHIAHEHIELPQVCGGFPKTEQELAQDISSQAENLTIPFEFLRIPFEINAFL